MSSGSSFTFSSAPAKSDQIYETVMGEKLKGRLMRLSIAAGFVLWPLLCLATFHPVLLLDTPFWSFVLQFLIITPAWSAIALIGLLPLLHVRKTFITRQLAPPLHSTRLARFSSIPAAKYTWLLSAAYLVSSAILFIAWWQLSISSSPNAHLQVIHQVTLSSGRKVWQLNPRLAYLATASLTFTITYTIQQCIFSFEPLRFPTDPQFTYLSDTCLEAWKHKTTTRTAPLLLGCNLAFPVAWVILKGPILRALVYNTILRPYFAGIHRHWGISFSVLLRTAALTTFLALSWDLINALIDVYCTRLTVICPELLQPNNSLLQGLKSPDRLKQHLAYLELAHIAKYDSDRRQNIFNDIRTTPHAFESIARTCLVQLGRSYRLLQGRGVMKVPEQKAPASRPSNTIQRTPLSQINIESGSIIKPAKPSFLDKYARTPTDPQPRSRIATARMPEQQQQQQNAPPPSSVPSIFRSSSAPPQQPSNPPAQNQEPILSTQPVISPVPDIGPVIQRVLVNAIAPLIPAKIRTRVEGSKVALYLNEELVSAGVKRSIPDMQIDALAVQALSDLLCHSTTEDKYGLVQKELPKILEAFMTLLSTLDGFIAELRSKELQTQDLQAIVKRDVEPLLTALRNGTADILRAYQGYLGDFRFPPPIASKLQSFANVV